ncbi:MAG: MOSC domain-containing protein [Gemmatimonadota bacterium]
MLVSVNVALPSPLVTGKGEVLSGIRKLPVMGRVRVGALGLDGDAQADLKVHGGPDQAVYAYSRDHYARWAGELARDDLAPGSFGENLTVEGMLETDVRIGDVYQVGSARLQVTKPRSPCFKLAAWTGLPTFPKLFLASGRTGFYLRVLEEGEVGAGDAIALVRREPDARTVLEDARRRWGTRTDTEEGSEPRASRGS